MKFFPSSSLRNGNSTVLINIKNESEGNKNINVNPRCDFQLLTNPENLEETKKFAEKRTKRKSREIIALINEINKFCIISCVLCEKIKFQIHENHFPLNSTRNDSKKLLTNLFMNCFPYKLLRTRKKKIIIILSFQFDLIRYNISGKYVFLSC